MKKKPFRIVEERLKYNYIKIALFKKRKIFSCGVSTSIGDSGIGDPDIGEFPSFFEAKNTALHKVIKWHKSPKEKAILRKFRLMKDLDQPLLFDDL